mgnify:CR=1 FL=1|jgi:hypothetical protein
MSDAWDCSPTEPAVPASSHVSSTAVTDGGA